MKKNTKKNLHPLELIFIIMIIVTILTYIIPAGNYDRTLNDTAGRLTVIPGTFKFIKRNPVSIGEFLLSFQKGLISSANILGFLLLLGGGFEIVSSTGAIEALMARFITKFKSEFSQNSLIFGLLAFFALSGAIFGMFMEALVFVPFLISLMIALKYDALLGISIPVIGISIGYGTAFINPFSLGIAQEIAELPYLSGIEFRLVFFVGTLIIAGLYLTNYAKKIKCSTELSITNGIQYDFNEIENLEKIELTKKHKRVIIIFTLAIGILIYGAMFKSFFMNEVATMFFVMGIVAGIANGYKTSEIAENFIEGAKSMALPILIVGFSRSIVLVLETGQIIDTIIHYSVIPLQRFNSLISAPLMVVVQTFINMLVNSGSGQAIVTMPIMVPIADLLNINRQVAVLAFQIGDGFSNMIWFTSGVLMAALGLGKVGYSDWLKFIWKLTAILLAVGMLVVTLAQFINLGPI